MLSPQTFLEAIITSLRTTIAPAISEPFPKAQAYMAAVILEFVARQVEERTQSTEAKRQILDELFAEIDKVLTAHAVSHTDWPGLAAESYPTETAQAVHDQEARLCRVIETLYAHRDTLGPELFETLNQCVRTALRATLDQDLQVAKP
jgi:hypothetical protein